MKHTDSGFVQKYKALLNPDELISDKLKKYNLAEAEINVNEKANPYPFFISKARKAFNNAISVYKLSNEVLEAIKDTGIDKMPDDVPQLYNKPFIIEAHDPNSNLFGDVNSIVGFYNDYKEFRSSQPDIQKAFIMLLHIKHGKDRPLHDYLTQCNQISLENSKTQIFHYLWVNYFYVRPFENRGYWDFNFVDYNRNILNKKEFCDTCEFKEKCKGKDRRLPGYQYHLCLDGLFDNLLSFITVFNYMMEADNKPLQITRDAQQVSSTKIKKGKVVEKTEEWITKYIYLNNDRIKYEPTPEPTPINKDGLVSKETKVKRHLRHQACGEGHKDHKWLWIESYVTTKWVKEGDTKIIVGLNKDKDTP